MGDRPVSGYHATRDADGVLTIHRVPIFVECKRGDFDADEKWIKAAVAFAKSAEAEGYLPPLHIRHHETDVEVRAAGFFRIVEASQITFKGASRLAVFADLVITDRGVQEEVLSKRLPYRSVEIFDISKPAINSLALLDHEAPYLELPMLMVRAVDDRSAPVEGIAYTRVAKPWREANPQVAAVACFRLGAHAHLLFQDAQMGTETKGQALLFDGDEKTVDDEKPKEGADEEMAAEGDHEEPDGDESESSSEVAAVCDAIRDGSISVAELQDILAAIEERKAANAGEEETDETPAPAQVPGEAMQNDTETVTKLAGALGEIEALKAQMRERDASDQRRTDVAEAMKRLAGRPLGADLETKLEAFHKEHGGAAFKAHVDSMVASFAAFSGNERTAPTGLKQETPEVALKYQAQGVDAVNRAARFAAEHAELKKRGAINIPLDRYVELSMARTAPVAAN